MDRDRKKDKRDAAWCSPWSNRLETKEAYPRPSISRENEQPCCFFLPTLSCCSLGCFSLGFCFLFFFLPDLLLLDRVYFRVCWFVFELNVKREEAGGSVFMRGKLNKVAEFIGDIQWLIRLQEKYMPSNGLFFLSLVALSILFKAQVYILLCN